MDKWKCISCADCCKYTVKINDNDIKNIKKAGYSIYDVATPDHFDPKTGKFALKLINGECIFLTKTHGKYVCKIYSLRPKICRDYPFFNSQTMECQGIEWKTH